MLYFSEEGRSFSGWDKIRSKDQRPAKIFSECSAKAVSSSVSKVNSG